MEWYTPAQHIEAARAVLGTIDLDPASSDVAQTVVKAGTFFTADDDGLTREWHGNVWLNPPYRQPLITQFVAKLLDEITAGRVRQSILLTNASTDTAWFQRASSASSARCFTNKRIRFWAPDGRPNGSPTHGQVFFYFGSDVERFAAAFGEFGSVTS